MADLSITMHGDASGAAGAMKDVAHEASNLHEVLEGGLKAALGSTVNSLTSFEAVGEKVVDIVKESIEEYAKAEEAHRQLAFVAKNLTEEFEKQAEVIAKNFAVRDEDVEHMQTLLLRYGAAPEVIGEATKAVLNYAAATGTDANSAMMMLIRGVENGHGSLGRMGVQFKATGDFAMDLAEAVKVLNDPEHFGGAGETAADGLSGRMRSAEIAVDELKKSFGGFFALLEEKSHLLEVTAGFFRGGWSGMSTAIMNAASGSTGKEAVPSVGGAGEGGGTKKASVEFGNLSLEASPEAIKKEQEALEKQLHAENEYLDKKWMLLMEDQKKEDEHDDEILKGKQKLYEAESAMQQESFKRSEELTNEAQKDILKQMKQEQDDLTKLNDITITKLTGQKHMWENAGMQLGQAFATALENAMAGGTESAEDIALDLTQSVLTLAGGILGSIAGEGDPYAAQAGSMLGHLAGAGIKAGVHATDKHHDGGWIERYHSGGWPVLATDEKMIIAQEGERMLSRQQVRTMGGPAAVDAAARGGGGAGIHIHMNAIDTRSSREFFENDGGRGFYNALRTGRGSLTPLLTGAR